MFKLCYSFFGHSQILIHIQMDRHIYFVISLCVIATFNICMAIHVYSYILMYLSLYVYSQAVRVHSSSTTQSIVEFKKGKKQQRNYFYYREHREEISMKHHKKYLQQRIATTTTSTCQNGNSHPLQHTIPMADANPCVESQRSSLVAQTQEQHLKEIFNDSYLVVVKMISTSYRCTFQPFCLPNIQGKLHRDVHSNVRVISHMCKVLF